jgi:cell division septation protein DedD
MDGVLLVASVERIGRSALRDAFLELWGSDAPMIGCLGIGVPRPRAPEATRGSDESGRAAVAPTPEPPTPAPSTRAPHAGAAGDSAPTAPEPSWDRGPGGDAARRKPADDLVQQLSEEVRTGSMPRARRRRSSRVALLTGVAFAFAAAVGIIAAVVKTQRSPGASAPLETLPPGTEEVLPAQVGGPGPAVLPPGESAGESAAGGPPTSRDGVTPYRVHVASFRSELKVRDMVKTLRARGLDAWYELAPGQQGWYRVFVGHYATRQEAAQRAEWLLDHRWVDRAIAYPDSER